MPSEKPALFEEELCLECFILSRGSPKHPWSMLLQGPPKVGKSMFCRNYVRGAKRVGRPVVYVTTDEAPDQILGELKDIVGTEESIRLVDCYSWRLGLRNQGGLYSSSSANLSDLSVTMQKALGDLDRPYIIFDSISSLALDANEDSALRFLRILVPRIRMNRSFSLFTLSEGLHSSSFVNALRTVFDGIIEMKIEESRNGLERLVRVFATRETTPLANWTRFSVTGRGIVIGSPFLLAKTGVRYISKQIQGKARKLRVVDVPEEPETSS